MVGTLQGRFREAKIIEFSQTVDETCAKHSQGSTIVSVAVRLTVSISLADHR